MKFSVFFGKSEIRNQFFKFVIDTMILMIVALETKGQKIKQVFNVHQ